MKETNVANGTIVYRGGKIDSCSCLVQISLSLDRIVRDKIIEDIPRYNPSLANDLSNKKIQSHRHPRQNSHHQVHFHGIEA